MDQSHAKMHEIIISFLVPTEKLKTNNQTDTNDVCSSRWLADVIWVIFFLWTTSLCVVLCKFLCTISLLLFPSMMKRRPNGNSNNATRVTNIHRSSSSWLVMNMMNNIWNEEKSIMNFLSLLNRHQISTLHLINIGYLRGFWQLSGPFERKLDGCAFVFFFSSYSFKRRELFVFVNICFFIDYWTFLGGGFW